MKIKFLIFLLVLASCKKKEEDFYEKNYTWQALKVTATAYNSVVNQTNDNPNLTAFGDSLKPGMKCIAVSKDLLIKGLKHNTPVKIEGFNDVYIVKDKMHSRWKNRIDIYMGEDVQAAKEWGRKKLKIEYGVPKESGLD